MILTFRFEFIGNTLTIKPDNYPPFYNFVWNLLTVLLSLLCFSESWDCVVTCYFIDTAHNVIAFIENIEKILKPGGYWINLGKFKRVRGLMRISLGWKITFN